MRLKTLVTGAIAGILLTLGASASAWAVEDPAVAPAYAAKGELTCMKCHDSAPVTDILKTPHAVKGDSRTPFADHGCESCHGASPEHIASAAKVKEGEKPVAPAVIFNGPGMSPVEARNEVCLSCHKGKARVNWQLSEHSSNDVACASCHTIHVKKDPVLVRATQPDKCFTCHAEQRAQSFEYSHHPIREGKVVCGDCHSPHGSPAEKQLKQWTANETCYNCHPDKRGPFAFNHESVRENCMNCHTPHGSTQPRLLTERPPYLCETCHDQQHQAWPVSGRMLPGNMNIANSGRNSSGVTNPYVSDYGLALSQKSCLTCHSQIHGSNSPAGKNLTR